MSMDFGSIRVKLGLCLLGLFLINAATVGAGFYFLKKSEDTGAFINIAGRQRMLSQKMVKEALGYAATGNAVFQEKLKKTASLFQKSLDGLKSGNSDMNLMTATADKEALQDIMTLSKAWLEFKKNVDLVINAKGVDDPALKQAIDYLAGNNLTLLKQANILTKRYEAISRGNIRTLQTLMVGMLVLGLSVFGLCIWIVQSGVVRPIDKVVKGVKELATGNLSVRLTDDYKGELGSLSAAFNSMAENFQQLVQELKDEIQNLDNTSNQLKVIGDEVSEQAGHMERVADSVNISLEVVNENIQMVSHATDDLTTATTEIAQSVSQTAQITNSAQEKAEGTNEVIGRLRDGSDKIGNIIQVINTIAEQTNLLALNATIEAARAGEAGKGFAVVANEVKELAKQTGEATQEITSMIQNIQTDTREAVTSVEEITAIIGQINDLANTIASAAEEQTATVSEISNNVSDAAYKVTEVKEMSNETRESAAKNVELAAKNLGFSNELKELAHELGNKVSVFKV